MRRTLITLIASGVLCFVGNASGQEIYGPPTPKTTYTEKYLEQGKKNFSIGASRSERNTFPLPSGNFSFQYFPINKISVGAEAVYTINQSSDEVMMELSTSKN